MLKARRRGRRSDGPSVQLRASVENVPLRSTSVSVDRATDTPAVARESPEVAPARARAAAAHRPGMAPYDMH